MGYLFFVRTLFGLLVVFGNDTVPNGARKGTPYNHNITHFVLKPNPASKRIQDEDEDEVQNYQDYQEYHIETGVNDDVFYRICYLYPVIMENYDGTITYLWEHGIFSLSVTIPRGANVVDTMLKHNGYNLEFENKLETEQKRREEERQYLAMLMARAFP